MKALLLLAFGGPRCLDEVEFLLTRLFHRPPSPEQLERVKDRYRLIGGCSPLPEISQRQADALEKALNNRGTFFKSYVGMLYGYPLIEETMEKILRDGLREILALPLTPFQSSATTGAYIEEVKRVSQNLGEEVELSFIGGWHSHPLFLEAVREKIREGLMAFSEEERRRVHLLFTAHSLPISVVKNDPYVKEIKESVNRVMESLDVRTWHLTFQSKGSGSEQWVGPEVESVLTELSDQGVREVLVVPIGFVSDHIEILYDIDIFYRQKAEALGMVLKRTHSLNTSEKFIQALASAVEEQLGWVEDSRVQGIE